MDELEVVELDVVEEPVLPEVPDDPELVVVAADGFEPPPPHAARERVKAIAENSLKFTFEWVISDLALTWVALVV